MLRLKRLVGMLECNDSTGFVGFFFFSSRRRHTRCSRDWSSDVCSSDLLGDQLCAQLARACHKHGSVRRDEVHLLLAVVLGRNTARVSERTPAVGRRCTSRSEEHTSELQSRLHLVCRLLLEKKKTYITSLHQLSA